LVGFFNEKTFRDHSFLLVMNKIQSHAKLVIIGGGIMGVSLLYHLA